MQPAPGRCPNCSAWIERPRIGHPYSRDGVVCPKCGAHLEYQATVGGCTAWLASYALFLFLVWSVAVELTKIATEQSEIMQVLVNPLLNIPLIFAFIGLSMFAYTLILTRYFHSTKPFAMRRRQAQNFQPSAADSKATLDHDFDC
jgi:uncharacterized paraquat-inducible protein A